MELMSHISGIPGFLSFCFPGLGPTVSELDVKGLPVFPKTQFSMMIPEVESHLKTLPGNHTKKLKIKSHFSSVP